jgi:hypothetical protein
MRVTGKLLLLSLGLTFVVVFGAVVAAYSNGSEVVSTPTVKWVSHTEYWSSSGVGADEKASTIVRLTDYRGNAYNVDGCTATLLYPNKTAYITDQPMVESTISGNWYRNDTIPDVEGTYEQEVTCTYNGNNEIKTSQSFHVNPALNFIKQVDTDVLANGAAISNVNLTLKAKIADANASITATVNAAELSINNLLNTMNATVFAELDAVNATVNTHLTDVNLSLDGRIGVAQTAIQTQLTESNTTLSALINAVYNDLNDYLVLYLPAINTTTTNIFTDSQWLVNNAMNQDNAADITNRFDRVDQNISVIEDFCTTTQTNTSALCQEVYGVREVLDLTRAEQTSYFTTLNETTTNTWDLLSGDVTTNINTLLSDVGIIKGQTTQINDTVVAIRADQTGEIRIQAIA